MHILFLALLAYKEVVLLCEKLSPQVCGSRAKTNHILTRGASIPPIGALRYPYQPLSMRFSVARCILMPVRYVKA